MGESAATKVRPFLFRPGARYQCFGDGGCCSDIHGLGPLTRRELVQIRRIDPNGAVEPEEFDQPMLQTKEDGTCLFRLPDRRCGIHAEHGYEAKPGGCRRFPLGLVATPRGGRVTTDHRCSCRTIGARPELTPEGVEPALVDDAGRLVADRRVREVRLDRRTEADFAEYEALEAEMVERLVGGDKPERVLRVQPFPPLRGKNWKEEAEMFTESGDMTRFGEALAWFGDGLLALRHGKPSRPRRRPWAEDFERSHARPDDERSVDAVLGDWAADELWALRWADEGWSLKQACAEMATRLAVARWMARRLIKKEGLRQDHAAAEAVLVIDSLNGSDYWDDVVKVMRV